MTAKLEFFVTARRVDASGSLAMCKGRAAVPSGASTADREALELRDKDPVRYGDRALVTEPALPDAAPAGAGNVVGTQLEALAQIAAELGDQALASEARADHDRLMEARFSWDPIRRFPARRYS